MLGDEYGNLENYKEAANYYSRALELDHQNVKALQGLNYIYSIEERESMELKEKLECLTKETTPHFWYFADDICDLDLNPDRSIDFRKYQLIIRLFLEQFHKGVKKIS
jgi:tetratricopeptide (TPR) repeat protein